MRKNILVLILIILAILCFIIVLFGIKIGNFKINSYKNIEKASIQKKSVLAELNQKNTTEYQEKKNNLNTVAKEYKNVKLKYDELVSQGKISENSLYNLSDIYEIELLGTTIKNYAIEKGVTLKFDITQSISEVSISPKYIICDLNFTITGEYIPITDFVYSISNDDRLNFKINDFILEKEGESLQATFIVKNVPISSEK